MEKKGALILGAVAFGGTLAYLLSRKAGAAEGLVISDLSINPPKVNPGDGVEISCLASNNGSDTISYELTLGGDFMASKIITLAPGASQSVSFQVTAPNELGVYNVSLDGLSGKFTVTEEPVADIRLSNLIISPQEVYAGDTVTISATATNYGNASGSRTITLTVT